MATAGDTWEAKAEAPFPAKDEAKRTWFQSRVSDPLYQQVAAGATAESLAQSAAMGLAVGVGPLPGLSGIIVARLAAVPLCAQLDSLAGMCSSARDDHPVHADRRMDDRF
jgi:hypothetical protein